jgi:hypothetical protein
MLSPTERSIRARLAAHELHAQRDARETTARARAAFLAKFEQQVDPDGVLDPEERRRRAAHARQAHFQRMALKRLRTRAKSQPKNQVTEN